VSPPAGSLAFEARSGMFHGQPTIGLASPTAWFEALAADGPRIVRLGLAGGANLLAETPDIAWPTADGPYRLWGGHRLWLAPEDAGRNASPDAGGLAVERLPDGLRLTGAPDPGDACVRAIEVRLDACRPLLRLRHEVANRGARQVELAVWAITQLPPGGTAILPQAPAVPGHATRPNRAVVLWPYASWDDPRLVIGDGVVAVHGAPGPETKVGSSGHEGWAAWARDGVALVRRWVPTPDAAYPDLGCSAEVYVTERYTELEVLGPLTVLEPGGTAVLDETWELREVEGDLRQLRETIAPPIETRPASVTRQHEA
jgi:hypothetical protein